MGDTNTADEVRRLALAFAAAVQTGDRAAVRAACTPEGLLPGETPAALFMDAQAGKYALVVGAEVRVADGARAAIAVALVKAGHAPRGLWLLAEARPADAEALGLAGVTASRKVAEAFLAGIVPASVALGRLPPSPRGAAFGARLVQAQALHGRVSEALGTSPVAAMAAGMMLDRLLASPGATLEVGETRELAGRAAVRLVVHRPELSQPEDFWLVLELAEAGAHGRREAHEVVRATAATMSLEVLLAGVTPEPLKATRVTSSSDTAAASATAAPHAPDAPDAPDAIDAIFAALDAATAPAPSPAPSATAPSPRAAPLDAPAAPTTPHDPAAAEALRVMLQTVLATLPERPSDTALAEHLRTLLAAFIDGLARTVTPDPRDPS